MPSLFNVLAACTPSKNSPGTYATCYKQHSATVAKPPIKPTAVNPGVIKSRFPKPLTTGALQQGQVKFVTDLLPGSGDLDNFKTRQPQQPTQNTTSTTPTQSGGGTRGSGQTFKEIRCQTGCRGDVVWAVVLVIRVHVFNTK